jgi:hypothetical protein
MKIDVVCAAGPYGDKFVKYLIENVLETRTKHEFNFILTQHKCDLTKLSDHPNIKKIIKMPDQLTPESKLSANISHGICINECFKHVDTEYTLIIDYDVAFLTYGWDEWMIEQMSDPKLGIIGSEYSDAARGYKKYLNYPSLIMSLIRTDLIRKYAIDFRPNHNTITISNQFESQIYGRPIGVETYRDTGWELSVKLRSANILGSILKYIDNATIGIPGQYTGQEFSNNHVTINHLKSGSIQKPEFIDYWNTLVQNYINSIKKKS